MLGNRLKLIRLAHAMSLQDMADQIARNENISLHRSAIFGYENSRTTPNESTLKLLAREMGVPVSFFFKEDWANYDPVYLFKPHMAAQREAEASAYVQVKLERIRDLNDLLGIHAHFEPPAPLKLQADDAAAVENLSVQLRERWKLGIYPISGVCDLLESIGWNLLMTPNTFDRVGFNNTELVGYEASCGMPFILYNTDFFPDELRLKLLRLAGHAYIQSDSPENTQKLVSYFARAILFSQDQVLKDVGIHRDAISEQELTILKSRYGMPRRQIMQRLYELNVISASTYKMFRAKLKQNLFLKREPLMDQVMFLESPSSYELKFQRAVAEKILVPDEHTIYTDLIG